MSPKTAGQSCGRVLTKRMETTYFTTFHTALGACGIAWGEAGIYASWLPERTEAALRARIAKRPYVEWPPSPEIANVIANIQALTEGEKRDLMEIALDMARLGAFERAVYERARAINPGTTRTYGEIAADLGDKSAARAVGQALGRNPFPIIVPCHRVLGANGKIGGFSAPGGVATKLKLLEIEGALSGDLL